MQERQLRLMAYGHLLMACGGAAAVVVATWVWTRQSAAAAAVVDPSDLGVIDPTGWLGAMAVVLAVLAVEGWAALAFLRGSAAAATALRVFGFLQLFNVPLGTALGACTLWLLRDPDLVANPAPAAAD